MANLMFDPEKKIWRVTHAGITREHKDEWQARIWLHQFNSPSVFSPLKPECQDEQNP